MANRSSPQAPISPTSFSPYVSTPTLLGNAPGHSYLVVFTYWHQMKPEDIDRLNQLHHVKVTVLFTYSDIDNKDIEPYPSYVAAESLKLMTELCSSCTCRSRGWRGRVMSCSCWSSGTVWR
ncbi:hypothetical protein ABZ698_39935, partial [Streptomyces antibioticus]